MKYRLGDLKVDAHPQSWVAPTATVIGRVRLEESSSVWFGAVIRGDNELITIGQGSNVQDGAILHTDPGFPLTLGKDVTIGHQAMLHGCEVGDGSLIGIQAVVLNGARIGMNCLIGAKALVTEKMVIPDGSLVLGSPAKVVRALNEEQQAGLRVNAQGYVANANRFLAELSEDDCDL
ncbi:carbonic anhydrase/acetyltransferase-like protein (isoleucine patch superfamily) [Pseudomonas frederiksbergensis]|jgi:carbonic anhydrase/acetyltransferase-like protein (isoleucine patch superfamily)|uniref:gamma carbonic anhydrase family protein n=1 Tax=Pseudomonas frederiksbergensis TaxID=104087 RepID=UPI003D1DFA73